MFSAFGELFYSLSRPEQNILQVDLPVRLKCWHSQLLQVTLQLAGGAPA
jgi:hypothetical protein